MNKNQHEQTRKLTVTALLTAFTTVATLLIQIPSPTKGYLNLGDCLVNISAWILGPINGAAAAGIGSAMADMISGYAVYVPFTLVIKALMAVISYYLYKALSRKANTILARITAASVAEVVMILGYAVCAAILHGSIASAFISIPSNLVQGIMGAASSVMIYELVIKRIPNFRN